MVSKTGVIEYEEVTKRSPDNVAITTNPSYDVAMTGNPAYGHNVKNNDQQSHYYDWMLVVYDDMYLYSYMFKCALLWYMYKSK